MYLGKSANYTSTLEERRKVLYLSGILIKLMYMSCGIIVNEKDLSKDEKILSVYRKYLGNDYQPDDKYSTVIANHTSWADILYMQKKFAPGYISKDTVEKIKVFNLMNWVQKCIFISRKDKENLEKTVIFIYQYFFKLIIIKNSIHFSNVLLR